MMSSCSEIAGCRLFLPLHLLLLLLLLAVGPRSTGACGFVNEDDESRVAMRELLGQDKVRLVEYEIHVQGYSRNFWRDLGGDRWFQPWKWYRAKGTNSERLLLLSHYYFGILKPYLGIGTRQLDLQLSVNVTGCLAGLSPLELETRMRQFLYYDLKNETERLATTFDDPDLRVCSMHVEEDDGWGRLAYYCCSRDEVGRESCAEISDDAWVWVLRAFVITVTILLFLYFPKFIPKGYWVYSFRYYPPDGTRFNIVMTAKPDKYSQMAHATVLPAARWRKMRQFKAEFSKLQPDVVHSVTVKRVTFECGMDRLLSETSSPVSVWRSIFNSLVRCKVRHADPLEDCCQTGLCGELCCASCPAWHACLRALRTVLVLLLLSLPALPLLYALAADHLDYQQLADVYSRRDLHQRYNFYPGPVFGKVIVALLTFMYVLHMVLVVIDGCHDQNLARAYTHLLQVTRRKARLRDRISHSQSIIRKAVWPVKRFGMVAIPAGLLVLAVLPVILLLYLVFTSPVPKLLLHVFNLLCGKAENRRHKTKAEMTACQQLESVLFVVTLIVVFAVLTLGINFLVHVVIILLVQAVVDLSFVMKFLPILVLLLVYIRDAFRVVNQTYDSHHQTVLRHVLNIEADDIKREADKDWEHQENKIFKIVPSTAEDPKGRTGKDQENFQKKRLFFFKNDAIRMRTRSLVLFLDKDDIPYIPKKFLFHTTSMACPGCPGPLEEAYLKAAGRFGRTLVFLLFILLVVLAYADMYYISPTSTFFATLLTGTIPLFLRYFFMNPGPVLHVDTGTLRFQTQMDDMVESFQQSWVVEDLSLNTVSIAKEHDGLYKPFLTPTSHRVESEDPPPPPPQSSRQPSGAERPRDTPRAPPSSPRPPPHHQPQQQRQQHARGGWAPPLGGDVNYMMGGEDLGLDADGEQGDDGLGQYQQFNNDAYEPYAGPASVQQRSAPNPDILKGQKPRKKHKPQQHDTNNPLPLADHPAHVVNNERGENPEEPPPPAFGNGTGPKKPKKKKKGKKEPPRIDLLIDISQEPLTFYRDMPMGMEQQVEGGASNAAPPPPSKRHWGKRSQLVGGDDYDA